MCGFEDDFLDLQNLYFGKFPKNLEPSPSQEAIQFYWPYIDVVSRINIECDSFKGFCPLETRWDDSS